MGPSKASLGVRFLKRLADALYERRAWFFWPHVVLTPLCVLFTIAKLEFHTDRTDLVGGDKEYHHVFLQFKKEFPVEDDIVVVVESEQMEKNRQFVERLGAKLEATNLFQHVFYKGDLKMLGRKALFFVPESDLKSMEARLDEFQPFLKEFAKATNLVSLVDLINRQIRTSKEETNTENLALVKALPALERIMDQATDGLLRSGQPPSPGINALFEGGQQAEQQLYITLADGRIYLVTAQASSKKERGEAVTLLRRLVSETQAEVPGLNVGVTGEPVLEFDEMAQSRKDTTLATALALGFVALIFIYGYHETGRPLKATICLLVGLAYTMGFTTLTVGHLNILTIVFVPILVGLAIDFGVHLITRYEEELRRGQTQRAALEKAIVQTGMGIFTGAFTTAGAFFAMALTDFTGIREMGIICGGGLVVSLVPMMTLLPVLLLRGRQNVLDHDLGPVLEQKEAAEVDKRARIENLWLRRPRLTIVVVAGVTLLLAVPARKVTFDYNLLHMQSRGLPAVLFQNKLIDVSQRSVLFGAVVANDLSQATNLLTALTNLPTVKSVDSMAPYLAADVEGKLSTIHEIKQAASAIHFGPADDEPVNINALNQSLFGLYGYLGLIAQKVTTDTNLHGQIVSLQQSVSALRQRLELDDRATTAEKLGRFQHALFKDVQQTFQAIREQDESGRLKVADLPPTLRNRFIGVTSKYLLQVYPKENVWERTPQERFVEDLRRVYPHATGTPVQLYEYTQLLKESYQEAAIYALCAIAILVFIRFRKVSCVVLSLIPVGLGFLWMIGLMGLLGIRFNPANIMTLPLVVGIGVTNGIHILNRFAEEQQPSILAKSTGKAVLVSGLTTIAGFGSLIVAKHQGIETLGYVMATGTATCMLIGLTFLPAVLNLLNRHGWTIKNPARQCTIDAGSGGTEVKTSSR